MLATMHTSSLFAALSFLATASALSLSVPRAAQAPLPLIVWHGLGDRYDADGLQSIAEIAQKAHSGTPVYFIRLDDDGSADRLATFTGNVTEQIDRICTDLHAEPTLFHAPSHSIRVDALGFSQGGQFLRGLVERCADLRVRSLVTFGSQHNGITGFKRCAVTDWTCQAAMALLATGVWTSYVQGNLVPAQYYRTVNESTGEATDDYIESSNFLADINNERTEKNASYAKKIAALESFVMFVFENDTTVIPPESGWFAEVNGTSGEITPLQERQLYKEDWLGLKELDEKGGMVFRSTPGDHMQLDEKILVGAFEEYFGPERTAAPMIDGPIVECGFSEANRWYLPWDSRFWAQLHDWWRRPSAWNYDPNDWEPQQVL